MNLSIFGGNYTVDFETMQQINDDTGTARHVQRKVNPLAVTSTGALTHMSSVSHHLLLVNYCSAAVLIMVTLWNRADHYIFILFFVLSSSFIIFRGRHLCSAGRPSRWVLAHILVVVEFLLLSLAFS